MIGCGILALSIAGSPSVHDRPVEGERFYLVIFGAESTPYRTRFTHAWATFVRTEPGSDGIVHLRADTISWMPATLRIRPLALRPERGVNLTHEQTREWIRSVGMHGVTLGPFEIDRSHYETLLARKRDLESGTMTYRALGGLSQRASVSNCGQSFSRAHTELSRRYWQPTPEPGERGAIRLTERYRQAGAFLRPELTHDWLLPVLGIEP